jgi:DNA ligase (NAD+)
MMNSIADNRQKINPFDGCIVVVTGKLSGFTRDTIRKKIVSLGATAGTAVTNNTHFLICGERAGSKLRKARELGIVVLSEREFLRLAESA